VSPVLFNERVVCVDQSLLLCCLADPSHQQDEVPRGSIVLKDLVSVSPDGSKENQYLFQTTTQSFTLTAASGAEMLEWLNEIRDVQLQQVRRFVCFASHLVVWEQHNHRCRVSRETSPFPYIHPKHAWASLSFFHYYQGHEMQVAPPPTTTKSIRRTLQPSASMNEIGLGRLSSSPGLSMSTTNVWAKSGEGSPDTSSTSSTPSGITVQHSSRNLFRSTGVLSLRFSFDYLLL